MCGSENLSPLTGIGGEGTSNQHSALFKLLGAKGFWAVDTLQCPLHRARICFACGHAILYVTPSSLEQLRAQASQLDPWEP
jgi:hypothetical protein